MRLFRRLKLFFTREIWDRQIEESPAVVRGLFYLLRALVLVVRGLTGHRVSVWASALTYLTLISAVPFIALVAGIGAKLGVPGKIVESVTGDMPQAQLELLENAASAFERLDFRAVGAISVLLLVYAAVKVLVQVERAFNEVWGVDKIRGGLRRLLIYIAVVVIAPVLLMLGMVLTGTFLSSAFIGWLTDLPYARTLISFLIRMLPFLTTWTALTFLYWLVPNTRVKLKAALLGGFVAGILSQIAQQFFFQAQIGVSRLGIVYGAFAAIPIFLVWVYLNWILILLGTEISYGAQHAKTWFDPGAEREEYGPHAQDTALRVALWLGSVEEAHDAEEIGQAVNAPARLVTRILGVLAARGIVKEGKEERFRLARKPEKILAAHVTDPFVARGSAPVAGPGEQPGIAAAVRELRDRSAEPYRVPLSKLYGAADT